MILTIVVSILITALGGFAVGIAGFGFALVTTPILLLIIPQSGVVILNLTVSVVLRIALLIHTRKLIDYHQAIPIIIGGLIGMEVGIIGLKHLNTSTMKIGAQSLIIVLSSMYLFRAAKMRPVTDRFSILKTGVGFLSGALNTTVSVSGPPIVLWLLSQQLTAPAFRATITAVSVTLNIIGIGLLLNLGADQSTWLWLAVATLPSAAIGMWFGNRLLPRVQQTTFIRGAVTLVIIASLIGITMSA